MRVELPYGRELLPIDVLDTATVLRPQATAALPDAPAAVLAALRSPIAAWVTCLRIPAHQRCW